jgi:glutamyl-tRNA reductase
MHTIVVGLNYKTTQVNNREKVYFSAEMLDAALPMLQSYPAIKECVILSTCNRVEIYAVVNNIDLGFDSVTAFIGDFHDLDADQYMPFVYKKNCEDAIRHLFNVVCSLDSKIVGEYEILGQVKGAYDKAQTLGCTKELFNRLFQMAFEVGKRVRTETAIGKGAISVGSVATNQIRDIFPGDRKLNIMLIGAGAVAELTAKNIAAKINCNIIITNRSLNKAEELAKIFTAECVDYNQKHFFYANMDVLVFSTGAEEFVLKAEDAEHLGLSAGRRLALIDLSVPRNIDPALATFDGISLHTVDDLESVVDSSMEERAQEIVKAEGMIREQEVKFFEWFNMLSVFPVMRQIKQEFVGMQTKIFNTFSGDLAGLNDYQREIVKKMMESYSDVIIKTIMLNLKEVTDPTSLHHIGDALKKTFKIHDTNKVHA